MNIQEIRQQFPQYDDLSDEQLADALHKKFYSDMPREEFNQRIGLQSGTSAWDKVVTFTDQMNEWIPYGDEISAGVKYATGMSDAESFDQALAEENARRDRNKAANPKTAALGSGTGGALVALGAPAAGLTTAGAMSSLPLWQRSLLAGSEAAAWGGLYASDDPEEGQTRSEAARDAFAPSFAVGAALPVAGELASRAYKGVRGRLSSTPAERSQARTQRQAARTVKRYMDDAGISPEEAIEGVRGGRVLGQQDDTLMGLTRTVQREVGPSRKIINDALQEGFEANQQGATRAVREGLGGADNIFDWLADFKAEKMRKAKPLYEKAFQQNWGPKGPPDRLEAIVRGLDPQDIAQAEKIARYNGKMGAFKGGVPSLEEAEYIRRALDDRASTAFRNGDSNLGNSVKSLSNDLRTVIDDASPLLKSTRKAYADDYAIQRAAEEATKWMNKSGDYIEFAIKNMTGPERQAAAKGLAAALKDQIERGQMTRDQVRVLFGSKQRQRALEMLWQDAGGFDQFRKQMENAAEFNLARQNVVGNSKTQMDFNNQQALEGIGGTLVDAVEKNRVGLIRRGVNALAKRFGNASPERLSEVARVLMERDPARFEVVMKSIETNPNSAEKALQKLLEKHGLSPLLIGASGATQR